MSAESGLTRLIGENGYMFLGVILFAFMGYILYRLAINKNKLI